MKKAIIQILLACVAIYYRRIPATGTDSNAYCQMASSIADHREIAQTQTFSLSLETQAAHGVESAWELKWVFVNR